MVLTQLSWGQVSGPHRPPPWWVYTTLAVLAAGLAASGSPGIGLYAPKSSQRVEGAAE